MKITILGGTSGVDRRVVAISVAGVITPEDHVDLPRKVVVPSPKISQGDVTDPMLRCLARAPSLGTSGDRPGSVSLHVVLATASHDHLGAVAGSAPHISGRAHDHLGPVVGLYIRPLQLEGARFDHDRDLSPTVPRVA